ncbi:uncharacterized protein LOC117175017 [Belonocnema kinseyi]|uniref:uncharacterized protein LOC117175017 n=1 Tax=Belonocnema kinseyi TaxID=2817044 RepID=UPI00143DAB96|nr:uncharacterized protein LOC117175017 [Belonocnema kinseyi]
MNADYPKAAEMDYYEQMMCWQAFTGFTKYLNTAFITGETCYDRAVENKKIKIVNNCYNKIIVGLEKETRLVRASSEECIANMVRKMATVKGRRRESKRQSRRGIKNQ